MKIFSMLGICIFLVLQYVNCQVVKPEQVEERAKTGSKEWSAGSYRGLHVGKSKYADVRRILGRPKGSGSPHTSLEVWYEYPNAGEFESKIVVIVSKRTKIVLSIDLYPESLTKKQAIEYFGPEYVVTRYDFDECLGDEESGPMYESSTGALTFIEYRHRGIAISLNADENVNEIRFVKGPMGTAKSKCNASTSQ